MRARQDTLVHGPADVRVTDLRLVDVGMTAAQLEGTAQFAAMGLIPDAFKAYMAFNICHTLPEVLGPVQSGNMTGFTPEVMAASHASLNHQQMNIRHLLRVDDAEDNPVTRDRIIGAVVATSFPKPAMGYKPGQSYAITAHAVVFKLAEGVNRLLGDHVTSRVDQSVSIEVNTNFGNIGVHRPSTNEFHPILNLPKEWQGALKEEKASLMPHVGKLNGEQLIVIYGMHGKPILMRGVGVTPNPAERAAKIIGVAAELKRIERDEETCYTVSAEAELASIIGMKVPFQTGRRGTVYDVVREGAVRVEGTLIRMTAKPGDPVLKIRLPDHRTVLRHFSEVMDAGA